MSGSEDMSDSEDTATSDSVLSREMLMHEHYNEKEVHNQHLYEMWVKMIPNCYDFVITRALDMPLLTVQWLPGLTRSENEDHSIQKLVLGTDLCSDREHYLLFASVKLPNINENGRFDKNEDGVYEENSDKIRIESRIKHEGRVIAARFMPQNSSFVATSTAFNDVLVYDCTNEYPSAPILRLKGHIQEGNAVSWNPNQAGHLLSGSGDETIRLWDINSTTLENNVITSTSIYIGHTGSVTDVDWNVFHNNVFGSTDENSKLMIWDTRCNEEPCHSIDAHCKEVCSLSFNPFNEFTLATGSLDKTVGIWDLRNLNRMKYILVEQYSEGVMQVLWSGHNESVLASSNMNKTLGVWNLKEVGECDILDEVSFCHRGYPGQHEEFSWNPIDPSVICTATDYGEIQVWKMGEHICRKLDGGWGFLNEN